MGSDTYTGRTVCEYDSRNAKPWDLVDYAGSSRTSVIKVAR